MTEFVALAGVRPSPDDASVARVLRGRQARAVGESIRIARTADGAVFAERTDATDVAGRARTVVGDRWTVVADASIYYTRDLALALQGVGVSPPRMQAPGVEWIHQALVAWGTRGVQHLEGDFSFAAWDAVDHRLVAARDHAGGRTLYYATVGSGIAVGSSLRALCRVPGVTSALNLIALIEDAAHLELASATETAYAGITRIPAGHQLVWSARAGAKVDRWWDVPIFERSVRPTVAFEEAAVELRRLLVDATAERMDAAGDTAIMLSGGYDSPAVYGAAQLTARGDTIHAISFSHPVGDPGRENELIELTTRRFGREPHWVEYASVDALGDPAARAALRDEPLYHTYELWNHALASASRATGARVALNGVGGDAWFSCSPIFMADLFRTLQWRELAQEWRLHVGSFKWYAFYRNVVLPNLPESALRFATWMRNGRRPRHRHYREIPAWIRRDFSGREELEARRHFAVPRRHGETLAGAERSWFLRAAFPERIGATVARICSQAGVELRSPLNDARIVRFAATRPRWESNSKYENKHLLRAALRDALPAEITVKRAVRTGLPTTYLVRTLRAHAAYALPLVRGGLRLADLGVVDPGPLMKDLERCATADAEWLMDSIALADVVMSELWLRADQNDANYS